MYHKFGHLIITRDVLISINGYYSRKYWIETYFRFSATFNFISTDTHYPSWSVNNLPQEGYPATFHKIYLIVLILKIKIK
jgi:hypothetical protein